MPEQTPTPTPPATPATPASSATPEPPKVETPAGDKAPPWGKPENFDPDKAWELIQNLRTEKGGDSTLRAELEQMRVSQTQQRDALAAALGVKPEETSDTDKLAGQIETLRGQITASERRALAIEYRVPENMLTATDAEGMRTQAKALVEFAEAAHYAAVTAGAQTPPPAFQQNPGQGQGGAPQSPEAIAATEYEKFYPAAK